MYDSWSHYTPYDYEPESHYVPHDSYYGPSDPHPPTVTGSKKELIHSLKKTPVFLQQPDEAGVAGSSRSIPSSSDRVQPSERAPVRRRLMANFVPPPVESRPVPQHLDYYSEQYERNDHWNSYQEYPQYPGDEGREDQRYRPPLPAGYLPPGESATQRRYAPYEPASSAHEYYLEWGGTLRHSEAPFVGTRGTAPVPNCAPASTTASVARVQKKPVVYPAVPRKPQQIVEGSTLEALASLGTPKPPSPVEPRTDDRLLVSSVLNLDQSPEEPKRKRIRKRGQGRKNRKRKANEAQNLEDLDGELMTSSVNPAGRREPVNLMASLGPCTRQSAGRLPMNLMSNSGASTRLPEDIDGDELSDMSLSGDEAVAGSRRNRKTVKIPEKSSTFHNKSPSISSKTEKLSVPSTAGNDVTNPEKFVVNLISGDNADKFYPPRDGEIYKFGSSLFKCIERPYFGTVFDRILQYVPLPDHTPFKVPEEDKTKIYTGHRYTVWLDKAEPDYLCMRKLCRGKKGGKFGHGTSYRGFSRGHGILRLHVRDAFLEEHCPLANSTMMGYLQRALPNCPPPSLEFAVTGDEPSNILIAAITSRPKIPGDTEQSTRAVKDDVECSMLLFPHYIDSNHGEPTFPESLRDPVMKEKFNIFQFQFRANLKIFQICDTVNGVEAVHLPVNNHIPVT